MEVSGRRSGQTCSAWAAGGDRGVQVCVDSIESALAAARGGARSVQFIFFLYSD